jgi:hypothetical protein
MWSVNIGTEVRRHWYMKVDIWWCMSMGSDILEALRLLGMALRVMDDAKDSCKISVRWLVRLSTLPQFGIPTGVDTDC